MDFLYFLWSILNNEPLIENNSFCCLFTFPVNWDLWVASQLQGCARCTRKRKGKKQTQKKPTSCKMKRDKTTRHSTTNNSKDQHPFMCSQIDACIHLLLVERHLFTLNESKRNIMKSGLIMKREKHTLN